MTIPGKKKYKSNFLTNAICRIDFREDSSINENLLNQYREAIKSSFPKVKELTLKSTKIHGGKIVEMEELPDRKIFQFDDTNSENRIQFSCDHLTIESFKYINFTEFSKVIEIVLNAFSQLVPNPDFTRLGLRYINQIILSKGNPLIWSDYIESSFVAAIDRFFERTPNLARAMSQVVLNYDDYKLNFNYGMHNSEFPAKISRKEFILDFDYYTEYVELDQIMSLLTIFNKESAIMFERCIKEKLRSHMGVIDE